MKLMIVERIFRCAGTRGVGGLAPLTPSQAYCPSYRNERNLKILGINLEIWEKGPRKKSWIQPCDRVNGKLIWDTIVVQRQYV